jgi:hypothetical protein
MNHDTEGSKNSIESSVQSGNSSRALVVAQGHSGKTVFQLANEQALKRLQQREAQSRMEKLAERLGLSPDECHIEVRATPNGVTYYGLLKFIVRLPWGVREVTAAELRFIPGNEERVGRELFGYNANTAADILSQMESLGPSEVIAWTNGRTCFLDVIFPAIRASIRVSARHATKEDNNASYSISNNERTDSNRSLKVD